MANTRSNLSIPNGAFTRIGNSLQRVTTQLTRTQQMFKQLRKPAGSRNKAGKGRGRQGAAQAAQA